MNKKPTILYTKTDESPAIATHSLLPIIRAFTKSSGIEFEVADISLAARILGQFPEYLTQDQRVEDTLAMLGERTQDPNTNIIKLPNISASLPQMLATIKELKSQGYNIPDYPENPQSPEEQQLQHRYNKAKGSAVNPILRDGNSDRRAPKPVKKFAQNNPHWMGEWRKDSKSHVSCMSGGDFYGSEESCTVPNTCRVDIVLSNEQGKSITLKSDLALQKNEVIDASFMSALALSTFVTEQIQDAKKKGVLFSVHLKATMMKVSDPIIFGHIIQAFYKDILNTFSAELAQIGFNPNNGIGDLYKKINTLPQDKQKIITESINALYEHGPKLAMVNSDKGITNLHVPNNVIIDASMPAALRNSGKMWDRNGEKQDAKFVIPDRSYASIYQEVIDYCTEHGAFDVATMGSVSNVGLMAQKAEEYGSHDKTWEIPFDGTIRVQSQDGSTFFAQKVQQGDIWRMCQSKDAPIQDWVKMAVSRARAVGSAIFWLDQNRAHDAQLIEKVKQYLQNHDTEGLDIQILAPKDAMRHTLNRVRSGQDTVSVTGNILRDYLTDLFPIFELGTSAKMLSIVPLMKGGALLETGAGGSAPALLDQFFTENHLCWDSLGEFLALQVSLEHYAEVHDHARAKTLADALNIAITEYLQNNRSPKLKVHELDTRGSHFYLALYWAQALREQNQNAELKNEFGSISQALSNNEQIIVQELNDAQGNTVSIKGYYNPCSDTCTQIMRPSQAFNRILDNV
ncbi:MAG: isocitrate dehydrogenase (NADP(+)) [Deltaproteobacteria bacterium]|nr:isocitrate dehydrogenase (NADP(+)) [Deltaproteobacteria bacterium]